MVVRGRGIIMTDVNLLDIRNRWHDKILVSECRSALLRQPLFAATLDAANPACKKVRQSISR